MKKGKVITRKRVKGWIESGRFKYGAMGSKRQGDEAAILIIDGQVAIISCVRFSNADPDKNPYLNWAARQAYQFGASIQWYASEERAGKHTARVKVFSDHPEAQAAIAGQARIDARQGEDPWLKSLFSYGRKSKVHELV